MQVHQTACMNMQKKDKNNFYHFHVGLSLVPEWDSSGTGIRLIRVDEVEEGGVAEAQGVNEGDEVMLVNDVGVVELGWKKVVSALEGK